MSLRALAVAVCAAVLGGCAGLAPPQQPEALVGYFAAVAKMAPAGQKQALAQAAAALGSDPTPLARVRLGGLHAQPAPALRDDARALSLLDPRALPEAGAGLADLAALLYAQVAERQRQSREEAKKFEALRERNESMKERMEAIKAIERSIQQREERQRNR